MSDAFLEAASGGRFVDWGVLHVSVANLIVIGAMVVVFVLALVLPFPGHLQPPDAEDRP
ncbi:MAG TPA: hypothetical protein VFX33_12525 [Actinomycetales bacterium]|nr:hypothetical protein [Actinomycetales bacterium]